MKKSLTRINLDGYRIRRATLIVYLLANSFVVALADVRLPAIISDHMVLRAGVPVAVWGWASPEERVSVSLANQTQATTADAAGEWRVTFSPLTQSSTATTMTVKGHNTLTVEDVLVGEVWLGSGQSNIELLVRNAKNSAREQAGATFPEIRLFTVKKTASTNESADVIGSWEVCSSNTVGKFSATLYFFGRELHQQLRQPVGLIHSSWGGTPIQAWMPKDTIKSSPHYADLVERKRQELAAWPEREKQILASIRAWEAEAAKGTNKNLGMKPRNPRRPDDAQSMPTRLYRGQDQGAGETHQHLPGKSSPCRLVDNGPMPKPATRIVKPPAPADRQRMVGWFDPGPLIATGFNVVVSTLFGRHSDYRLLEALAAGGGDEIFDYSRSGDAPREDIWLDYIADTGDGWNSTYALAYWCTRPTLSVATPVGSLVETRSGHILVFGGDQVYPAASYRDYHHRLVKPFETARNYSREPEPEVFAIPGNHDWYDSLVSFTRLFCSGRWFQGWRTRQKRSYFALRLPQGVWLVGADMQLGSDIDALQIQYFKKVAAQMKEGDRIIICMAEPHWVYATAYEDLDPEYNENNLRYFERVLQSKGTRIVAYIAGDLHHYRRHEDPAGVQKITAGGGGAFLHPTHAPAAAQLYREGKGPRSHPGAWVTAESRWGNGHVSGPVRQGRHGPEVRLPEQVFLLQER